MKYKTYFAWSNKWRWVWAESEEWTEAHTEDAGANPLTVTLGMRRHRITWQFGPIVVERKLKYEGET